MYDGWVAEWLCSGLQSRGHRFDSVPSLHIIDCPGGEIGRRKGLKIPRNEQFRAGSTPAPGTNQPNMIIRSFNPKA